MTINLIVEEKYQKRNDKAPNRENLAADFDVYNSDDYGIFVDVVMFNNVSHGVGIAGGGYDTSVGMDQARGRINTAAQQEV